MTQRITVALKRPVRAVPGFREPRRLRSSRAVSVVGQAVPEGDPLRGRGSPGEVSSAQVGWVVPRLGTRRRRRKDVGEPPNPGTARTGRFSATVIRWVIEHLGDRSDFDVELFDPRDHVLPFFDAVPPARTLRRVGQRQTHTACRRPRLVDHDPDRSTSSAGVTRNGEVRRLVGGRSARQVVGGDHQWPSSESDRRG